MQVTPDEMIKVQDYLRRTFANEKIGVKPRAQAPVERLFAGEVLGLGELGEALSGVAFAVQNHREHAHGLPVAAPGALEQRPSGGGVALEVLNRAELGVELLVHQKLPAGQGARGLLELLRLVDLSLLERRHRRAQDGLDLLGGAPGQQEEGHGEHKQRGGQAVGPLSAERA